MYEQDIALVADLGLNAHRFSIEWARIEPEEGSFSRAELEHYRRVLETCHKFKITPLVTYSHFSVPRWFALNGGWVNPPVPERFARYCRKATEHLGVLSGYAVTLNEPNAARLIHWVSMPPIGNLEAFVAKQGAGIRRQLGVPQLRSIFTGDTEKLWEGLLKAHVAGKAAIKSVRPNLPVSVSLAMQDEQLGPTDSHVEEKRSQVYVPWLQTGATGRFHRQSNLYQIARRPKQ